MIKDIVQHLTKYQLIDQNKADQLVDFESNRPLSLFWELRLLLYLGIILVTSSLGIFIYQNIDTIGHQAILVLILAICIFCFYYTYRRTEAFTNKKCQTISSFADLTAIAFGLTFVIFLGYIQFVYQIFDYHFDLLSIFTAIIFFISAYIFDHKGLLTMAITALATSLGLAIAPLELLQFNQFSTDILIISAIFLGLFLALIAYLSNKYDFKKHFEFTYLFLGANLLLMACTIGTFETNQYFILYAILALTASVFSIYYARNIISSVFLLMGVLYGYSVFSFLFFYFLFKSNSELYVLSFFYFIFSCFGVITFLKNFNKILGKNEN